MQIKSMLSFHDRRKLVRAGKQTAEQLDNFLKPLSKIAWFHTSKSAVVHCVGLICCTSHAAYVTSVLSKDCLYIRQRTKVTADNGDWHLRDDEKCRTGQWRIGVGHWRTGFPDLQLSNILRLKVRWNSYKPADLSWVTDQVMSPRTACVTDIA